MKAIFLYVEPVNYTPQGGGLLCKVNVTVRSKKLPIKFCGAAHLMPRIELVTFENLRAFQTFFHTKMLLYTYSVSLLWIIVAVADSAVKGALFFQVD